MRISLLSVPVEPDYTPLMPKVRTDTDVLSPTNRAEGQLPVIPKIAIVSIIQWMEKSGYSRDMVDFYDVDMVMPSDDQLIAYFKRYQPTVVGLSAVVSTCYAQTKRLARLLRQACPDAWIVLGGSLSASSNLVLRKTDCDLCAIGDGEVTWVDFLKYVEEHGRKWDYEALSKIQGLAYLDAAGELQFTGYGKAIPAVDQPFPDYDLLTGGLKDRPEDLANYFRKGLGSTHFQTDPRSWEPHRRPMLANLWSSKGCVARCTFCQRSTKGYRVPTISALEEHLILLRDRFNVGFIHILDENFGSDREYAYELARTMKKLDMLWMASGVRVSSMEYEYMKFFKEHGCVSLKFGVETGAQKIMDIMEKKFTVERVFKTLQHCADLELYSPLAVMVGMPGETNETAQETGRFLGRVSYMQGIDPIYEGFSIFYALPMTGTPLYVYGQQVGAFGKSPEEEEKYLLSVSGTGANKVNYINLNGAKLRDVIFWDWLVRLEARKTFYELCKAKPLPPPNFLQRTIIADKQREIAGRALTFQEVLASLRVNLKGIKNRLFYGIDSFVETTLMEHPLTVRLPRWIVFPFVKNLVYFEYLMQKAILRLLGRNFNLFQDIKTVPALRDDYDFNLPKSRSLRTVVRTTAQSRPPASRTEANQDVLAIGL